MTGRPELLLAMEMPGLTASAAAMAQAAPARRESVGAAISSEFFQKASERIEERLFRRQWRSRVRDFPASHAGRIWALWPRYQYTFLRTMLFISENSLRVTSAPSLPRPDILQPPKAWQLVR